MASEPLVQPTAKASTSTPPPTPAVAKSKDNSYFKLEIGKFYKCGEPEHKFNECPKRRQVNMTDYEEDDVLIEIQSENSDFREERGDLVAYVIQKMFAIKKSTTQHNSTEFFIWGVRSKIKSVILSLTMMLARRLFTLVLMMTNLWS